MAAFSTLAALAIGGAGLAQGAMGASAANKAAKAQKKAANNGIAEQRRQFEVMRSYLDPVYQDSRVASQYYMTALGLYPDTNYRPEAGVGGAPVNNPQTGAVPQAQPQPTGAIGRAAMRAGAMTGEPQPQAAPAPTATQPGQPGYTPGKTQADIISMVQNGPGYQTQLQQGINAVDLAANGAQGLTSGRRMMALNDYGQQTFGNFYNSYLDRLGGLAGQGAQVGGAIGQGAMGMANQVSGLMTQKGNAAANGAVNAANSWSGALDSVAGAAGWFAGQRPMTGGGM